MVDLMNWDPYRELRSMQDRFGRLLGGTGRRDRDEEMSMGAWVPPVDIAEEQDQIMITAELPGFKPDDIQINMEGNVLTLRGERKFEEEKDRRNYHRVERAYGVFVRSFSLPNNVDRENVKAEFRDGILELTLPKREEAKPRRIQVTGVEGRAEQKQKAIDVQPQPSGGQSRREPAPQHQQQRTPEAQPR
jgi:HSP20 family protein